MTPRPPAITLALVGLLLVVLPALPAEAEDPLVELRPRAADLGELNPPLPPPGTFPVQLVLDDDSSEGDVGVNGAAASQFLWFNAFDGIVDPFLLEEIWVLWNPGPNMMVGAAVELVVYHDPDGDPTNGADYLDSVNTTIQVLDGVTFSIDSLAAPILVPAGGSVYLGVIDRFVVTGVTPPTFPAAIDTDTDTGRAWLGLWTTDPPSPPLLPPDNLLTTQPGTWMIRGFGTPAPLPTLGIPTLDKVGLALLVLVLALLGTLILSRRAATVLGPEEAL